MALLFMYLTAACPPPLPRDRYVGGDDAGDGGDAGDDRLRRCNASLTARCLVGQQQRRHLGRFGYRPSIDKDGRAGDNGHVCAVTRLARVLLEDVNAA